MMKCKEIQFIMMREVKDILTKGKIGTILSHKEVLGITLKETILPRFRNRLLMTF